MNERTKQRITEAVIVLMFVIGVWTPTWRHVFGVGSKKAPAAAAAKVPAPMTNAAYVRANHCRSEGDSFAENRLYRNSSTGAIGTAYGWRMYICPNGVRVVISNDEDQP